MEVFESSTDDKKFKLMFVEKKIRQVLAFLTPYLPLARAHNSDFIVRHHWESFVPAELANDLLSLDDKELCLMPSGRLFTVETLVQCSASTNVELHIKDTVELCHDIDHSRSFEQEGNQVYCTAEIKQNNGDTLASSSCKVSPMSFGSAKILLNENVEKSDLCQMLNNSSITVSSRYTLADFVSLALSNTLPQLDVLTSVDELRARLKLSPDKDRVVVSSFMKTKKSYEVDIMAALCAELAKRCNLINVFDIGTGRGYLGCHLALMHGLKVIGVDSSSSNTGSAATRTRQLHKQWRGLTKHARENTKNGKESNHIRDTKSVEANNRLVNGDADKAEVISTLTNSKESSIKQSTGEHGKSSDSSYEPITMFVHAETNLDELMHSCWPTASSVDDLSCQAPAPRMMLTGLHTCGNLSANVLRIFASRKNAVAVCQVGCCYNLLDERFVCCPYLPPDNDVKAVCSSEFGFPMCDLLTGGCCQLGRNALMLASHSPERAASTLELPPESIYWRSLLQVVLRDAVGYVKDDWSIGKIAAKCQSFEEYAQRALKILGIKNEFTDEQLIDYTRRYADQARKNVAFFQLKTVLAPCIEALVLLDRLAFLLEQHDVADAHIVPLFEAVKSPRRYAIVAVKSGDAT